MKTQLMEALEALRIDRMDELEKTIAKVKNPEVEYFSTMEVALLARMRPEAARQFAYRHHGDLSRITGKGRDWRWPRELVEALIIAGALKRERRRGPVIGKRAEQIGGGN